MYLQICWQDVTENQLGSAGAKELGILLSENEQLKVLRAADNLFDEEDAEYLAEAVHVRLLLHNYPNECKFNDIRHEIRHTCRMIA